MLCEDFTKRKTSFELVKDLAEFTKTKTKASAGAGVKLLESRVDFGMHFSRLMGNRQLFPIAETAGAELPDELEFQKKPQGGKLKAIALAKLVQPADE